MTRVVLHIGLHKTATRFLQRALLHSLDQERFLVNPPEISEALRLALRDQSDSAFEELKRQAERARERAAGRALVISDPEISGSMYNNHRNYIDNLEMMNTVFPDAVVLYFVRQHADWLQSAYRQSLVKGKAAPIELFLNFREGDFRERIAERVNEVRNVDARALRFLEIYKAYADWYGPEDVYLFRQQDLKICPERVYARVAEALGVSSLPKFPARVSGNRAFSALALRLFFPGTRRGVDWNRVRLGTVPPHGALWRLGYPLRRLRTIFVRHGFDRVVYKDWDLLQKNGMRETLEALYAQEQKRIDRVAARVLDEGPTPRARAEAERDDWWRMEST